MAKKWLQKATKKMEKKGTEGDFTEYCKRSGFAGVSQECINHAAKAGGRPAKMALFAANASKGKYSYPKGSGKKAISGAMSS